MVVVHIFFSPVHAPHEQVELHVRVPLRFSPHFSLVFFGHAPEPVHVPVFQVPSSHITVCVPQFPHDPSGFVSGSHGFTSPMH